MGARPSDIKETRHSLARNKIQTQFWWKDKNKTCLQGSNSAFLPFAFKKEISLYLSIFSQSSTSDNDNDKVLRCSVYCLVHVEYDNDNDNDNDKDNDNDNGMITF